MRIIDLKDYRKLDQVIKLMKKHLGENKISGEGYALEDNGKLVGYALYQPKKNEVYLDWIWAPGYGYKFLKRLEQKWKKYDKIVLKISIDPTENKNTVLRRLNFYIKMKYRATNIKFRPKYGPILTMQKSLK